MTRPSDLAERHRAEASFHDHKYATGDSFPRHYRVNPTYPVFVMLLEKIGADLAGMKVLEYGCGTGWITAELARRRAQVSAFDISPEAVAQTASSVAARGLASQCSVRVMAGEALEYGSDSFDLAIGFAILHHLEMSRALGELYRVLKPGGRAFFAEPLASNPAIRLYRRLTPKFRTADERPIHLATFARQASAFTRFTHDDKLLIAPVALGLCYIPGLSGGAPWVQSKLMRLDDALLKVAPWAGQWAWYSILMLEK